MLAKFPGWCPKCKTRILVGTPIERDTASGKFGHTECPTHPDNYVVRHSFIDSVPSSSVDMSAMLVSAALTAAVEEPKLIEVKPEKAITLSHYQLAFLDFVEHGVGNGVANAVAGSGKTTILVKALSVCPKDADVAFVAFNKHIVTELKDRQDAGKIPANATICTLHSLGMKEIRCRYGHIELDEDKVNGFMDEFWPAGRTVWPVTLRIENRVKRSVLKRIVGLCKSTLIDYNNREAIDTMMERYGIAIDLDRDDNDPTEEILSHLAPIMEQCKADTKVIDFDDMPWLPVVLNLPVHQYDFVFADECQDLNNCQIAFILKAIKPNGRIIAVGDPAQSLYGWKGADTEAMPRLIKELHATVLPLSISYRCPKSHVVLAQQIVPELEAAPGAIEGEILDIDEDEFAKLVAPGDMVICRTNAPLVEPAYRLIRSGIKATIRGRDIGAQLINAVDHFQTESINDLLAMMSEYFQREIAHLIDRGKDIAADAVQDRYDTLSSICSECVTDNVSELRGKLQLLFSDDKSAVTLSSVHRAKGLEADRVFILHPELMPHPRARKDWEVVQEFNCLYVARTRSKSIIYLVHF